MADPSPSLFLELLTAFKLPALQESQDIVYGLWPDLSLAFTNAAWTKFAANNGGEPIVSEQWRLGRNILDAIPQPLKAFYESHYRNCLSLERPWEHIYECSTPDALRMFHMTALPVGRNEGILVINSLRIETPMDREAAEPLETTYRNRHGMLIQCAHCRRFRRAAVATTWDWVRDWVRSPRENVSHGICEPCLGFYYRSYIDGRYIPKPISTI
ncbi:MAG: hypothetical protein K8U03_23205 [Planctomycetia bacterium]|nr:hypothetical protein [Planctomycetia bacterium]